MTRPDAPRRRWHLPRRRLPDDDLLAGFDRAGRPRLLQVFFATTIAASLLVWDLAFTLGAYHTIFYSRLFQIFVVSTVLLAGTIVLRKQVRVRPWMRMLLAVPLLWVLSRSLAPLVGSVFTERVLDDVTSGLTVLSVPFTLWAVARVLAPDYFALPTRRLKLLSAAIIAMVALTGFLAGQFNYVLTTCQSYVVAGDDEPANCRPDPSPSP